MPVRPKLGAKLSLVPGADKGVGESRSSLTLPLIAVLILLGVYIYYDYRKHKPAAIEGTSK